MLAFGVRPYALLTLGTYIHAVVDTYIGTYVCMSQLVISLFTPSQWLERLVSGTDALTISGPLWP